MARTICILDLLPVELLHILFTYFWAHEILDSFFNISEQINVVVLSYPSYRINFQAIARWHFDLICREIRPEQIILLTLSDEDDRPDHVKLFFSHFCIGQLIRLRSLTVSNVEFDSLRPIFSDVNQLHQLRSLSVRYITNPRRKSLLSSYHLQRNSPIPHFLSTLSLEKMIRLNRLNLNLEINLNGLKLPPRLRSLTLAPFTVETPQKMFSEMSQLKSLNVCLQKDPSSIQRFCASSQLRWLTLKIINIRITIDQMERFLANFPYLTHFEVHAESHIDLVNGHRWQRVTNDLIMFKFKFAIELHEPEPILDSFRTSFWLEKKLWYVAYHDKCLFSVPYFVSKHIILPFNPPIYSTAPDDTLFYDQIIDISISEPQCEALNRFRHLETLNLRCSVSPNIVCTIVDLNRLQHLILPSLKNIRSFMTHLNTIPHLSINGDLTPDFIEQVGDFRAEQIRTLDIDTSTEHLSYIVEGLIRLFPRVERLYVSGITLRKDMIRLINGFQHLSVALFVICSSSHTIQLSSWLKPKLFIRTARRFPVGAITCRFQLSSENYEAHLQIKEEPRTLWWRLPQRGYRWHRLMYILSHYPGINTIQRTCWNFNLQTFIEQCNASSKHFLKLFIYFCCTYIYVILGNIYFHRNSLIIVICATCLPLVFIALLIRMCSISRRFPRYGL